MSQFEICIRSIRYDIAVHTPDYLLYRDRFLLEAEFIHTLLISYPKTDFLKLFREDACFDSAERLFHNFAPLKEKHF